MDYLSLLEQDEKKALCELISGEVFKKFFIDDENFLHTIKKGFRANSLSENGALKLAIENINKPVIEAFINSTVDHMLNVINEDASQSSEIKIEVNDIAMVMSILISPFKNNVDLYLKLSNNTDENFSNLLYKLSGDVKNASQSDIDTSNKITSLEEENSKLRSEIEDIKEKYEQKNQDVNKLESSLTEAKNEIEKLKAESVAVSDKTDLLSQLDDTDTSLLPSADSEQIMSLCELESDYSEKRLIRHADLGHDGQYHIFQKDDDLPPNFKNRKKIYYTNGPSIDGFCGIWTWSATPNYNDTSKDYVLSEYSKRLDAIEVYTISEASDLDGLASILKDGIEYRPRSNKIIFAFVARGQYTGILCDNKKLATVNDKLTFASDCIEVPVYKFSSADILYLNNGLSFYKKAFAGVPNELYQLKSNLEIVKDIILDSFSWNVHKTRGTTRNDFKAFRDLLETIPVEETISKIEKTCHCSNDAANKLLNEFKKSALQYINGEAIEDDILRSVIAVSTELQEKTKQALLADWKKENQEQLDELRQENKEVQKALDKARQEEKRLSDSISDKKKLAKDVETAVNDRIQKAREKAADFIAEMAFAGGQPVQVSIAEHTAPVADVTPQAQPAAVTTTPYQIFPASRDVNILKAHHCWDDVIQTAAFELKNAGVAEKYRNSLAAFLCASYIEKQPILLAGPNAIDITQAFSAAVTAHKHGRLCCDGSYSSKLIEEIGDDDEKIVMINNLISSGWMNRIPEILSQKNIFYIITHPYAEDIQVEPKSLYGFMLPLFTELFVDKKASGNYHGGYFADNFIYTVPNAAHNELNAVSQLEIIPLVKNRISKLLDTMHNIYAETTVDEEFMFAVFPIAYATLNIGKVTELGKSAHNSESLSSDLQSLISCLK